MGSQLRIGLIGWGTVASALGGLVDAGPLSVEVVMVAVRDRERARTLPRGVGIGSATEVVEANVDAVVELAGGIEGPLEWARATLAHGRPYVTANKALLANHGGELAELASERGAALLASASVGGGTPMIELVEHLAPRGIQRFRGLLNATTTFVLSAMSQGATYASALAAAQKAGYAEADPSFDVEGRDAAQKLAILASVAWGRWRAEREVDARGIVGVDVQPGATARLVAEATEDAMSVAPVELAADSALARASGVEGVLEVDAGGAAYRVSGPGAGGGATAGAVYADLGRLAAGERPILVGRRW
ncbi:MAG TPA: homoserine dehydrogenase [Candidatus Limnocylindria bacterium]|nr:homoserine dehydrogenase [Candidatus Limnocylindria bacterium]